MHLLFLLVLHLAQAPPIEGAKIIESVQLFEPEAPVEEEPLILPAAVVERFTTSGDRVTRVSLFSDRVAVVSTVEDGERVFFRQMRLSPGELSGYLGALSIEPAAVRSNDRAGTLAPSGTRGVILLYTSGETPRRIEYQPMTTIDLGTSRLLAVLDELEARVSSVGPYFHELQGWVPREGDRVRLVNGKTATVDRVYESGSVQLRHDGIAILELVPPDQLLKVVLRRLPEEEP